ncbi:MAG: MBL fold metallo-hydrolase [Oscillospiraceae bacterium]|jgi:beta-lactamase superfamily II metal-dependent hydrolase|nr:MBL fold metallo-hydrolase [Oscillospiraceae bacterium]
MRKRKQQRTFLILAAVVALALASYLPQWLRAPAQPRVNAGVAQLTLHFIDVGQGDCTLIQAGGQSMLIDGGERGSEELVTNYLKAQNVERLDYVVATHPHSDHIGGLAYGVLEAFPVGTIIAPRLSQTHMPTTQTYERFLQCVAQCKQEGAQAVFARAGDTYELGPARFQLLGPLQEDGRNYNNDSVALRLSLGEVGVLMTGDAEQPAEKRMLAEWGEALRAQLMKAGHHGSKTSSTEQFLRAVQPESVVISCGLYNTYGHPSPEVLARCKALGISVCRTDIDGTLVFASDGTTIWRVTE